MNWLISFLVVWVLANVFWNYRAYKQQKFICLSFIFQGFFAAIPNLVVVFHEWLNGFHFWTKPIFMTKELRKDIEFLKAEQKARMEAITEQIKKSGILEQRKGIREEIEKGKHSLRKDWEKEEPKKKKEKK